VCTEASSVLRAVAADFFFDCWCLEIPPDNRIRHEPRNVRCHAQGSWHRKRRCEVMAEWRWVTLALKAARCRGAATYACGGPQNVYRSRALAGRGCLLAASSAASYFIIDFMICVHTCKKHNGDEERSSLPLPSPSSRHSWGPR
jgi:hypothetical protein